MSAPSTADVYAGFRDTAYFPSLNGIRAICALMVLKVHTEWSVPGAPRILDCGFLGVDMFFAISGFLIVTLLLREREASGRIDLKQFYVRRTLRIFPIYYLLVGLLLLLAVGSYGHSTKTWDAYKWSFPVFLLYLQDVVPVFMGVLFHTWSLSMEEQFYLIWPSVERFLRRAWIVPVLVGLIGVNELFNFRVFDGWIVDVYGPQGLHRPLFLITFTPILLGVLAAHLMHEPRTGRALAAALGNRWMPPLLLALAMLVVQYAAELRGPQQVVVLRGLPYTAVHVLFCLALVAMVINPRGLFSRTLQSRPLAYLGSISYGIYLYHTMIIWLVDRVCSPRHIHLSPFQLFVLVSVLSVSVAALSFRYIETPIMRTRHRKRAAAVLPAAHPAV
ncbi:MAG: acyltransferase [Burkholderiales bacterium]|nr:acyltransferase [Burkholderiales bacterium]